MFNHALAIGERIKKDLRSRNLSQRLKGTSVLLASTDVHEFGKLVVGIALKEAGVQLVDIGISVDADEIAEAACKRRVDAICVSTHNGMALAYAQDLIKELRRWEVEVPVFMGGKLNQDVEGALPRDVTADLRELRIIPCNDILRMLEDLKSIH